MSTKPKVSIKKACICNEDKMTSKILEALLKSQGYEVEVLNMPIPDKRTILANSTDFLIFDVDVMSDINDNKDRKRVYSSVMRAEELAKSKIIITASDPEDDNHVKFFELNKLDGLVGKPIDAMAFTTLIQSLKDGEPKRKTWRSSWK
jgi:DNA-binding response OmpR family regulator